MARLKTRTQPILGSDATRLGLALIVALAAVACADGAPLEGEDAGYQPDPGVIPPPPPPDKPGAPPPGVADPDAPGEPEPAPPEGEPGEVPPEGEPQDNCMGIDFLGVCHGTLAVWCDAGELFAFDCAEDGLGCDYIDADIGYYCVPDRGAPPPEGEPPPDLPPDDVPPEDIPPQEDPPPGQPAEPADPCPGVDWFGRCDGNTAVWCDDEEEILQFDCTWIGMVCQDLGFLGHRCVAPDQSMNPPGDPGGSPGG